MGDYSSKTFRFGEVPMKPQPLNLEKMKEETSDTSEKLDKLQKTYWDFDTIEEVKQRIRLAIQGLLKELEEEVKINEEEILDKSYAIYRIVIPKIKKWFSLDENETSA